MDTLNAQKTSRQFKDTVFRALFGDSGRFLELYNAVADEQMPDGTAVTPCPSNTLLARFNDLAALVGPQLVVFFEHQSSISKNMPLRLLQYVTDIMYSQIDDRDKLYGSTQVMVPAPKFFIMYNGVQEIESRTVKLSDSFHVKESKPSLELTAKVIDINYDSGEPALKRSASLHGYAFLISEIRNNMQAGMSRDDAIIRAIDFCIKHDILQTFLKDHYQEVTKMLNYEYDAQAERRILRQEGRQEGIQEGMQEGMQKGMQKERQEMIKLMLKVQRGNITIDEALNKARSTAALERQ
jgi:hypothetical protein